VARRLRARWLWSSDRPPERDVTIAIAGGQIVAIDRDAYDEDLGEVIVVPGFINAHTHLDLSAARGLIPPDPSVHFTDWLRRVILSRQHDASAAIRSGLREAIRFGTTGLVDIASGGQSHHALRVAPLRTVTLFETIGLKPERVESITSQVEKWWQTTSDDDNHSRGMSPHAPYSTAQSHYQNGSDALVASHIAEWRDEAEYLVTQSGPIRGFLESISAYDSTGYVSHQAVLDSLASAHRALIVHGNYLNSAISWHPNQALVVCPRTHSAFGHARHPWPELSARGVNVCLGTDSLASNPDLDLLAEIRHLWIQNQYHHPSQLLAMGTINAAQALGWAHVGLLLPSYSADFVAIPIDRTQDPIEALMAGETGERRTWCRGQEITGHG
jgi:aminodeoxyfutalosine deaminase